MCEVKKRNTERGGSVVTHETRIREVPGWNPGADQPYWGFFVVFLNHQGKCWIFKYLGVTVTNTNDIREETKRRINMGDAFILWTESFSSQRRFSLKQETHYERPARHGSNGLNGKQLRVTHYVPRRALPCRPLVMGYSQLLSIKTIRAVPCRDVPCCDMPCRAGRS